MLSLKFKATGKLDAIISLLDKLKTDIEAQQTEEDGQYATQKATYEKRISDATTARNNAQKKVEDLTNE